jgi:hypothetical protein
MAASTQTQSALAARRRLERPSRRAFGVPQDEAEGGGTRPESMLSVAGSPFGCADRRGRRGRRSRAAASPRSTVPAPRPGRGRYPVRRCRSALRRSRSDSRRRHSGSRRPRRPQCHRPGKGLSDYSERRFPRASGKPNLGGPRKCEAADRTGRFSTLGKSVLAGPPLGDSPWLCLPAD